MFKQKRLACMKIYRYFWKESYIYEKRPIIMNRDQHMYGLTHIVNENISQYMNGAPGPWKESYIYKKRPTYMKRDLHIWRLTQIAASIVQCAVSSCDCKHCSCAWICLSLSCPLSFSTRICWLYNVWVLLDGRGRGGRGGGNLLFMIAKTRTHTRTHARMYAHECTNSTNNTHYISSTCNKCTHTHTLTHALFLTQTHTHVHTPPAHGWDNSI